MRKRRGDPRHLERMPGDAPEEARRRAAVEREAVADDDLIDAAVRQDARDGPAAIDRMDGAIDAVIVRHANLAEIDVPHLAPLIGLFHALQNLHLHDLFTKLIIQTTTPETMVPMTPKIAAMTTDFPMY